jgi:predicted DNA-binding transcriptional regulator YafY
MHQLLRRVVIGRPATADVRAGLRPIRPGVLDAFERGFSEARCLAFDYRDRDGKLTTRIVEPQGLMVELPAWYLLARDRANGEPRMFRFDRIGRAEVLAERFDPNLGALHVQRLAQKAAEDRRRRENRGAGRH